MELMLAGSEQQAQPKKITVSEEIFGRDFNEPLVHQVVTAHLAGARSGTKAQKNRSAVRGGGAKPFRQKGNGRARAGTIRSPIWRTGGRTFAATPRDYKQKVNKKMYHGAMRAIISELVRQQRLVVVDSLQVTAPKTKEVLTLLTKYSITGTALLITATWDNDLYLASRNLHKLAIKEVSSVDPVSLIRFEKVIITADAIKKLEEML